MHKILILGPQGSGKGTQARLLGNKLGIPYLSMGNLLREEIASGSELGNKISSIINEGNLVSDELALEILKARLDKDDAKKGYILDGYPRNIAQLETYKTFDVPTAVLVIDVPKQESLNRMKKRAEIEKRTDDTPDVLKKRLQIYHEKTIPVINVYKDKDLIKEINGLGSIEEVEERINQVLGI